ncbi:MAG: chemotaxis protein CheA [Calditerrivibrio sp.]|nr:chemotaxis protein CheA [Calditerrivibrio sp.]
MSIDPKSVFIEEGMELLASAEESLLCLEGDIEDEEALNALFRVMHTFKGSAGVVGFDYIQSFTHKFENFLDDVRNGNIKLNSDIISLLLKCKDFLNTVLDQIRETGEDSTDEIKMMGDAILLELGSFVLRKSEKKEDKKEKVILDLDKDDDDKVVSDFWHISLRFNENFFMTGMDPYSFVSYLSKLGKIVNITTILNTPSFKDFDPEKCYYGFEIDLETEHERQAIADVFEYILDDCKVLIIPPKSKIEEYIKLINEVPEDNELIGQILVKAGTLTESELEKILNWQKTVEPQMKLGEILVEEERLDPQIVDAALKKQSTIKEKKSTEQRSLRVDAEKLDRVINIVGELVTTTSGILQRSKALQDPKLDEFSSTLFRLVNDLRDYSMELRMVPVGDSFNKFKRLVRDLGREFGKDIDFEIIGGETELDKTFIEKINDPLVHLIRNSIDHGIESYEERIKAGKDPKGQIILKAYNDSGNIVIEVTDDGKGLDKDKIGQKAVSMGLIQSYQHLSDTEVFNLIFEPGFSTAEKVTNISGRGVGMDVVRRNIEELHGTVSIESQKGRYTTIRIRLPLTLAIIDGFLVEVGKEKFVFPLNMVNECIDVDVDRLEQTGRQYISLRGQLLPYVDLHTLFDIRGVGSKTVSVVIVDYSELRLGLVVDEIHGEVQAVIKSLGGLYKNVEYFSGASILGDGSVALIVDIPKLIKLYCELKKEGKYIGG